MNSTQLDSLVHAYFALAISFNIVSLIMRDTLDKTLTSTDPVTGTTIMSAYYAMFLLHGSMPVVPKLIIVLAFLYSITTAGILKHIRNFSPENYYSRLSWFSAIAINAFGVLSVGLLTISQIPS